MRRNALRVLRPNYPPDEDYDLRSKDNAVSEANTLLKGERKKSFGQPAVNEVNTLLKEKFQKVGMSQQVQSLVSIR